MARRRLVALVDLSFLLGLSSFLFQLKSISSGVHSDGSPSSPHSETVVSGDHWIEGNGMNTISTGYDPRPSPSGCYSDGCKPEYAMDKVWNDQESRWSCSTTLAGVDECAITYVFTRTFRLVEVYIAFYKGNERNRKFQVLSSGTVILDTDSDGFDSITNVIRKFTFEPIFSNALTIRHNPDSAAEGEWFSLLEGIPAIDEDDNSFVPQPIARVDASWFDPRTNSGCNGPCLPINSLDLQPLTRWSCQEALGGEPCWIEYQLRDPTNIDNLNIAFYKGDERTRTLKVEIDGQEVTTITSSGTTSSFERFDLPSISMGAETLKLTAQNLGQGEWLSITDVFPLGP